MRRSRLTGLALACVVVAAAFAAGAGEKAAEPSRVIMTWAEFQKITGLTTLPGDVKPGEILIPWAEAEKLLGIKIKDVGAASIKLPWKEFRALVEWSVAEKAKKKKGDEPPPPADYLITKAVYAGKLSKEVAAFDVEMEINVLKKENWKRIKVLPATVGISEATLPKGTHLNVYGNMYEVLTPPADALPDKPLPVKLTFAASVTESGGMNSVTFDRVSSGTCVLDLTIDRKDVKVRVTGAQAIKDQEAGAGRRMLFALPAGNRVSISWERKIEEVKKGPPKLFAQTQTLAAVGDGIVTCREKVVYSIVHAGTRELTLNVPAGVNVLDVRCPYLHDWRVEGKTLKVQLEREVKGVYTVDLTYERAAGDKGGDLETPVISTADTERERGFIAVVALANVEISGKPEKGASAIDSGALPPELVALTSQPVLLAYRYVGKEFAVPLRIVKHKDVKVLITIVDAVTFTTMQTLDGRRITRVVYDVRNNRNQFLRIKMPAKTEIWSVSVSGKAVRPAIDEKAMTLIPLVRSTGQHLAAFPVEIVYIDKSFVPPAEGTGALRIELPTCTQPIMHVMCNVYLPKDGRYSTFAGPLKPTQTFRQLRVQAARAPAAPRQAQQEAAQIQRAVDARLRRAAPAGVAPIKVSLPISGTMMKFQKILVLDEELWIEMHYTHWPGYKTGWW